MNKLRGTLMAGELLKFGFFKGSLSFHQTWERTLKALAIHTHGYHLTHSCKFLLERLKTHGLKVDGL